VEGRQLTDSPAAEEKRDPAPAVSVVIPAKDEAEGIGGVLESIAKSMGNTSYEVVVVDDGSDDGTGNIARKGGARVLRHPYGMGNGAAVKAGMRAARGGIIALLDADGQHDPADLPRLLARMDEGAAMVVGARTGGFGTGWHRDLANRVYAGLASYVAAVSIPDLTSGYRVMRAADARRFIYLLPNTFSYPTTLTLSFLRTGRPVLFEPIKAHKRKGRSKIRIFSDGVRFMLIILRIATFFSPMKVFLPASVLCFVAGLGLYGWTWMHSVGPQFTNGMQLLLVLGAILFFLALVAEQVASLRFDRSESGYDDAPDEG
jgi:glycosyltransferase involved in cell wall biosynthesis